MVGPEVRNECRGYHVQNSRPDDGSRVAEWPVLETECSHLLGGEGSTEV